jgi:hypothetical protein
MGVGRFEGDAVLIMDASWRTEEGLESLLRRSGIAPKIGAGVPERILAAVMAPGAAEAQEKIEAALERLDLAPRVPESRRAQILEVAMRDGEPLGARAARWLREHLRVLTVAVPAAAAASLAIVLLRPGAGPAPEEAPAVPYVGEKGAAQAEPARRFRASLLLVRVGEADLVRVGELRGAAERRAVARGADLSVVYRNEEARPLFAHVGVVRGTAVRAHGPLRLEASREHGVLEGAEGPSFALPAGTGEARVLVILAARPAAISPAALISAVASSGQVPAAAALGSEVEVRGVRLEEKGR